MEAILLLRRKAPLLLGCVGLDPRACACLLNMWSPNVRRRGVSRLPRRRWPAGLVEVGKGVRGLLPDPTGERVGERAAVGGKLRHTRTPGSESGRFVRGCSSREKATRLTKGNGRQDNS